MKNIITYILLFFAVVLATTYILLNKEDVAVGTTLPVAGQTYNLAGSGVSSSATSFTLTSFTIPQTGMPIQDSMISDTFYMTIEPGNRSRQEIVGCTTVTQNSDGTATISGCTRGLSPVTPFTASTTMQYTHAGGSQVVLSNPPQLFEQVGFLDNDEAITGNWTAVTPTAAGGIATKSYVDGVVNGGAITLDGVAVGSTAGETFATGTIVYLWSNDGEWYKASAATTASSTGAILGVAQGTGADGTAISGGVIQLGYDTTNTGGTPGNTIYLSDTAGATSTSAGTVNVILGEIEAGGAFYFNPYAANFARLNAVNTFTATTTFTGDTVGIASTSIKVYTASSTWTKPSGLEYIIVEMVGGGGAGGGVDADTVESGGGGGGGGYCKKIIPADSLASTVNVTVGFKGLGTSGAGGAGQSSIFVGHATATGGSGGGYSATVPVSGGSGGSCTGGDISVAGGAGGYTGQIAADAECITGGGGGNHFIPSEQPVYSDAAGTGLGANGYGQGGGGRCNESAANGSANGQNGADGVVIIYEIY